MSRLADEAKKLSFDSAFDGSNAHLLQSDQEGIEQQLASKQADIENLRISYDAATILVAKMHEAAMGDIFEPVLGVVEDVANVRKQLAESEKQIAMLRYVVSEVVGLIRFQYTGSKEAMSALQEVAWLADEALDATQPTRTKEIGK